MNAYDDAVRNMADRYLRDMKDHILVRLNKDPDYQHFLLQPPGSLMFSTYITFANSYITIYGDLCPNRHGAISAYRYGVNWFASKLDPDYLAVKFLEKKWDPMIVQLKAKSWLKETWIENNEIDFYNWVVEESDDELTANNVYEACEDFGIGDPSEFMSSFYDYNIRDFALLIAIQTKFKELYPCLNSSSSSSCFSQSGFSSLLTKLTSLVKSFMNRNFTSKG